MRKYELMMIVNPALTEADRDALIVSIETELQDAGVTLVEKNHPGVQRLAYRIASSSEGYYLLYTVEHAGDFVSVTNAFNIKKDIWRFMFTKIEA